MTAGTPETPEHHDWSDAALDAEPVLSHRLLYRLGWVVVAVLIVVLLTVLPPLVNVNHYQRRVAQAITASIGRPVHFDQIHLHLLPLPGLTIQNFVVEEDPAFGTEPALRANTVEARLRLASLWRRRIEVSHITLEAPSINLVRRSDGRWSLQGIVTEAGHLQSAPTVQGRAGAAPRFPYIEATDARINIKSDNRKLPWSLLDAKLALWLPDETEWRVRLRGRPLRTDTDVSDVGNLELEGSLGRGSSSAPGGVLDQPLAISAHWASTPLGEASKLLLGSDTDFRGAASAELEIRGTPAHMQLSSEMHLHNLRRAEFVPRLPMSLDAHCQAEAMGILHALQNVRCAVPTAQSAGLLEGVFRSRDEQLLSAPDVLFIRADIPDLLHLGSARVVADLKQGNPEYLLNWSRVLSTRIPEDVTARGSFGLHAGWNAGGQPESWTLEAVCRCTLSPPFPNAADVSQKDQNAPQSPPLAATQPDTASPNPVTATNQPWVIRLTRMPVQTGPDSVEPGSTDIVLNAARDSAAAGSATEEAATVPGRVDHVTQSQSAQPAGQNTQPASQDAQAVAGADLLQTAPEQADPLTEVHGRITPSGMTLQYASARLARYAGRLVPPLGDNLPGELRADAAGPAPLESQRTWNQPQTWTVLTPPPVTSRPHHRPHR